MDLGVQRHMFAVLRAGQKSEGRQVGQHVFQLGAELFDAFGRGETLAQKGANSGQLAFADEQVDQHLIRNHRPADQLGRSGGDERFKLAVGPILLGLAARRFLTLHFLAHPHDTGVLGVGVHLLVFFPPFFNACVIFMGQGIDISLGVELRTARAAEHLMRGRGEDQLALSRFSLEERCEYDRTCGQVDAGRQSLSADDKGNQFAQEQLLHDFLMPGKDARVMDADAANEHLPQFGTDALCEVVFRQPGFDLRPSAGTDQTDTLQSLRNFPALVAVEAEHQRRTAVGRIIIADHGGQMFRKQFVSDPDELEWNATFLRLNERQFAAMFFACPAHKVDGIADGGREQHEAYVVGQQDQGKFPDDSALGIVEEVEFVHDHARRFSK